MSSLAHQRLIARLDAIASLSTEDRAAVEQLPMTVRTLAAGADMVRVGDHPNDSCVVLDGYLASYKLMPSGGRQILALHIPGDLPDLHSLFLETMDHSIGALTAATIGLTPHKAIRAMLEARPSLNALCWRSTLIDAAVLREWIASAGGRPARERMAHFLCEVYDRHRAVGLTQGGDCPFPFTQAQLSDMLGVTEVHVNRVLQALRAEGVVAVEDRRLRVLSADTLHEMGGYDPLYLHLASRAG